MGPDYNKNLMFATRGSDLSRRLSHPGEHLAGMLPWHPPLSILPDTNSRREIFVIIEKFFAPCRRHFYGRISEQLILHIFNESLVSALIEGACCANHRHIDVLGSPCDAGTYVRPLSAGIMWNQENLFSGVKKYSTHQFAGSGLRILMWRTILARAISDQVVSYPQAAK